MTTATPAPATIPDTIDAIDVSALKTVPKKVFDEARERSTRSRLGTQRPPHPVRMRIQDMRPGETLEIPCARPVGRKIQNSLVQAARRALKLPDGSYSTSYDVDNNRLLIRRWTDEERRERLKMDEAYGDRPVRRRRERGDAASSRN